jgi:short-subunit dehydrogenase
MNILVTGASKGIGHEIVKKFAENPKNNIIAIARDIELLKQLKGTSKNNIHIYSIDFLSETFCSDFDKILKQHQQHYDVIINNAGYLINKPFLAFEQNEIQQLYQVNVYAPIYILQKVFPLLDAKTNCHVINIGSMGGFQGSSKFSGLSIYSSTKAALANLSECLAEEFSQNNISMNCLALGSVQTEMLSHAFPGYKAEVSAKDMATYIVDFSINGTKYFNGKIIPIAKIAP